MDNLNQLVSVINQMKDVKKTGGVVERKQEVFYTIALMKELYGENVNPGILRETYKEISKRLFAPRSTINVSNDPNSEFQTITITDGKKHTDLLSPTNKENNISSGGIRIGRGDSAIEIEFADGYYHQKKQFEDKVQTFDEDGIEIKRISTQYEDSENTQMERQFIRERDPDDFTLIYTSNNKSKRRLEMRTTEKIYSLESDLYETDEVDLSEINETFEEELSENMNYTYFPELKNSVVKKLQRKKTVSSENNNLEQLVSVINQMKDIEKTGEKVNKSQKHFYTMALMKELYGENLNPGILRETYHELSIYLFNSESVVNLSKDPIYNNNSITITRGNTHINLFKSAIGGNIKIQNESGTTNIEFADKTYTREQPSRYERVNFDEDGIEIKRISTQYEDSENTKMVIQAMGERDPDDFTLIHVIKSTPTNSNYKYSGRIKDEIYTLKSDLYHVDKVDLSEINDNLKEEFSKNRDYNYFPELKNVVTKRMQTNTETQGQTPSGPRKR